MDLIETSAALGACLLVLAVAVALDRRPYRPGKRNYVPIMIVAVAAILVLGRHLAALLAHSWMTLSMSNQQGSGAWPTKIPLSLRTTIPLPVVSTDR